MIWCCTAIWYSEQSRRTLQPLYSAISRTNSNNSQQQASGEGDLLGGTDDRNSVLSSASDDTLLSVDIDYGAGLLQQQEPSSNVDLVANNVVVGDGSGAGVNAVLATTGTNMTSESLGNTGVLENNEATSSWYWWQ